MLIIVTFIEAIIILILLFANHMVKKEVQWFVKENYNLHAENNRLEEKAETLKIKLAKVEDTTKL